VQTDAMLALPDLQGQALESLVVGVLLLDSEGVLVYENAAARRMLGVPDGASSPALGHPISHLPSMQEMGIQGLIDRVSAGEEVTGVVVEFTSIFDKTLTIRVDAGALESGAWIMMRDLSADGPLTGRLLAAQRLEFVGVAVTGVIHDLNNLMTALGGTLEMLRRGQGANDILLSNVDGLLRRSRDVTRSLLQAARPGEAHHQPLDLRTPVRQAADLLRNSLGTGVRVHHETPDTQVPVVADRTLLLQCLFNLGVNARDAMKGRGEVSVSLDVVVDRPHCIDQEWPGHRYARIRVRDTGPGIPAPARAQIFEPFFSTKDPDKSTGMGLSVVKRAVLDHRGTLGLADAPGGGACFEIGLPFYVGPVEDDEPTRAMSLPASVLLKPGVKPLEGLRILVADDEPSVRVLLSRPSPIEAPRWSRWPTACTRSRRCAKRATGARSTSPSSTYSCPAWAATRRSPGSGPSTRTCA
jgi:signal transduction histidine kinase